MFISKRPDRAAVDRFLESSLDGHLSYAEVSATRVVAPAGYNIDHNRQLLGLGPEAFEKAKTAIRTWKMFDLPWVELIPENAPIEVGQVVCIAVRHFGFYSLNAARIVY